MSGGEVFESAEETAKTEQYWILGKRSQPRKPRKDYKYVEELAHLQIELIVDDEESLRDALVRLFRTVGLLLRHSRRLLEEKASDVPSCSCSISNDPGSAAATFWQELVKANVNVPIIFMTGHGDIPMTVKAMKAGAVEFLPKPFRYQDMLDAVQLALERDRARHQAERSHAQLRGNFESLSPREREVMTLVTAGLMNKQVAARLGIAEITVKFHRGSARSVAELARMAQILRN